MYGPSRNWFVGGPRRARWRGALAGVVPAAAVGLLFAVSGTSASPAEVGVSLLLVTAMAMTAGWLAGPVVARRPHGWLIAALAYALAFIAAIIGLGVIQAAWDAAASDGLDPIGIAIAVGGRGLYGLVGAAYLIVPAMIFGVGWSLAARGLARLDGWR